MHDNGERHASSWIFFLLEKIYLFPDYITLHITLHYITLQDGLVRSLFFTGNYVRLYDLVLSLTFCLHSMCNSCIVHSEI